MASNRTPDTIAQALGDSARLLVVKLDITSRADAQAAIDAVDGFGAIDVLITNVASFDAGSFQELTPERIGRQLITSLIGPMDVARTVLPVVHHQR